MRVFFLLGMAAGIVGATSNQTSAQVDDGMFVRPPSMELYFTAFEKLVDDGFQNIQVSRRLPPTVKAIDRAGDEVEITFNQVDGRILSIRYPHTATNVTSVSNSPSARTR